MTIFYITNIHNAGNLEIIDTSKPTSAEPKLATSESAGSIQKLLEPKNPPFAPQVSFVSLLKTTTAKIHLCSYFYSFQQF
jgi:hypothetical protein